MGSVGDCFDNSVAESFFGTLQLELLDEHHWESREQLALAIFEWIESWYNPHRRHSYCSMLSPVQFETRTADALVPPREPHRSRNRPLRCPQSAAMGSGGMTGAAESALDQLPRAHNRCVRRSGKLSHK